MPRRTTSDDYYRGGPLVPTVACVRCGRRPRDHETFLCGPCLSDPKTRRELRKIEALTHDDLSGRRLAIEKFHWAGGWGRRT